jgi:hypothetical protein
MGSVQEHPAEEIDFTRVQPLVTGNLERRLDCRHLTASHLDSKDVPAPDHLVIVRLKPGTQRDLDACIQGRSDRQPLGAGRGAIPFLGPAEERLRELPRITGTVPQFA